MLLRIQPEESLRSFIARIFSVNRYSPLIAELKKDSNFAVSNYEIIKTGKAMVRVEDFHLDIQLDQGSQAVDRLTEVDGLG